MGGEYVVEQISHELLEEPEVTYNFEVEDFRTYYVGNTSVLVHNSCGKGFASRTKLEDHFIKHGKEFGNLYANADEYLKGANYVIQNGQYIPELNGYIQFFGANGGANYAFIGMTKDMTSITTFGIRSVSELAKIVPWLIY